MSGLKTWSETRKSLLLWISKNLSRLEKTLSPTINPALPHSPCAKSFSSSSLVFFHFKILISSIFWDILVHSSLPGTSPSIGLFNNPILIPKIFVALRILKKGGKMVGKCGFFFFLNFWLGHALLHSDAYLQKWCCRKHQNDSKAGEIARLKGLQRAQSLQFIRNKINSSVRLKWGRSPSTGENKMLDTEEFNYGAREKSN